MGDVAALELAGGEAGLDRRRHDLRVALVANPALFPAVVELRLAGAEVVDENGQILGMVGQAGMAYIRTPTANGHLKVTWGELSEQTCSFDYALSEVELLSELVRMPVNCQSSI